MLALGVVDDVRGVGPFAKLAVQSSVAGLVLAGGYGFGAITNPLTGGDIDLGVLAPFATLLWIVAITNSFNLIDGLDGLAAGVALIAALTLLGVAALEQRYDALLLWATLAGCLAGFLAFNFPPASIFLGDSGSLFLGFAIAVLSVQSLQKGAAAVVVAVPLLTLGLPIADASYAVVRRWLVSGVAAIVRADRDHIHHRLLRSGFTTRGAVLFLYGCCAAFSVFAFLTVLARGPFKSVLVASAAVGAFLATRHLDRRSRAPDVIEAAAQEDG
jgi:UDP-GlcNAc:undecaprenyl-phosphate GlcNAc-1-phosphate transferase